VSVRYGQRLAGEKPAQLRLTTLRRSWYRLDHQPPGRWSWRPFPTARYRFDSADGAFRVRYAAQTPRVAMRERFDEAARIVRARDRDLHLVELTGSIRVLDLRRDRVLDALGLDDQISTARSPEVWAVCQRLADLVHDWFGQRCGGIVYRSRTTPERSANLAFLVHAGMTPTDLGPLGRQERLLHSCVLTDGFTIRGWR
jgi:hypothetical protein